MRATSNEENISIAWRPKLNPETPAFPEYPAHALGVLPAEWFENKINGSGIYIWPDGRKYNGEWKDNNMHGKGIYTWKDGRMYEGDYENDRKHGYGVYTWNDGK